MISTDEAWCKLTAELDAWVAAGKVASLWWRDDDAIAVTPALDRMLTLVNRFRVPLGLAVIPLNATASLADRLDGEPLVQVLQHGYRHHNHAISGDRAAEFGAHRPLDVRLADIADGWRLLEKFQRFEPIFVPPWNRYDRELGPVFANQGLRAVSAFGVNRPLASGIVECNCHVDIISWRTTRGFAGVDKTVSNLIEQLQARRRGQIPCGHAIGLLSHHLDHDDGCWAFLAELFARLDAKPAARWISPMAAARVQIP